MRRIHSSVAERCNAEVRSSTLLGSLMKPRPEKPLVVERVTTWMGSLQSVIVHTFIFAAFFMAAALGAIEWDTMLLVLTTMVSLEAIYLALFIQMTVNQNTISLREVEEDIDEIQEDVEEIGEDIDELQEDVEEISEDLDEIQEDVEELSHEEGNVDEQIEKLEEKALDKAEALERLTKDVAQVLADLEALKQGK